MRGSASDGMLDQKTSPFLNDTGSVAFEGARVVP